MPVVTDFDRSRRDGTERRGKKRMLRSGYAGGGEWVGSGYRNRAQRIHLRKSDKIRLEEN